MIPNHVKTIWQTKLKHLPRVSIKISGRLELLPVSWDGIPWVDRRLGDNFFEKPPSLAVEAARKIFEPFSTCEDCEGDLEPISSYSLKHLAEIKADSYISNGAVILAAALAGFDQSCVKRSISTRVLAPKALLMELRKDGQPA